MCGIFAHCGGAGEHAAVEDVVAGLKRLEYRGYDSWGVGCLTQDKKLQMQKQVGALSQAKDVALPAAAVALGHTRWATHGGVTVPNAHPHSAGDGSFMLVHNGVVENFRQLKESLRAEDTLLETASDSVVVTKLLEKEYASDGDMAAALERVFRQCVGRNAFVVLDSKGHFYAIRSGSPLLIGTSETETIFLSSDAYSLGVVARRIARIPEHVLVEVAVDGTVSCATKLHWEEVSPELRTAPTRSTSKTPGAAYIAEVHQAPAALDAVLEIDPQKMTEICSALRSANSVYTIGSGTAGVAAAQIAYFLRTIAKLHVSALVGAEAHQYLELFDEKTVLIGVSQSGETADVLEVLEHAKKRGATIISQINMSASSMEALSDICIPANVGPELAVMSSKVFVAMVGFGYVLAHALAGTSRRAQKVLQNTAAQLREMLADKQHTKRVVEFAQHITQYEQLFILASGEYLAMAQEAMVKCIEGTYIHAHAIPAGDLKHYAITLIEEGTPVLCIGGADGQDFIETAAHEVRARGASVLGVGFQSDSRFDRVLEAGSTKDTLHSLQTIVVLQELMYHIALMRGINPDRPRNIAKSVTVK